MVFTVIFLYISLSLILAAFDSQVLTIIVFALVIWLSSSVVQNVRKKHVEEPYLTPNDFIRFIEQEFEVSFLCCRKFFCLISSQEIFTSFHALYQLFCFLQSIFIISYFSSYTILQNEFSLIMSTFAGINCWFACPTTHPTRWRHNTW